MALEVIDLGFKQKDGKDYFDIVVNLVHNKIVMVKNAGCSASSYKAVSSKFNVPEQMLRLTFNGNNPEPERLPKKYKKLLNN